MRQSRGPAGCRAAWQGRRDGNAVQDVCAEAAEAGSAWHYHYTGKDVNGTYRLERN
jgi:hypothetical protein